MRPPEFTGGNSISLPEFALTYACFNEAAGIHRRKPRTVPYRDREKWGFNEAAGIHRRKRERELAEYRRRDASMRPPEFTGGNVCLHPVVSTRIIVASMRPPEFTGGNHPRARHDVEGVAGASMRPPEFTGGNLGMHAFLVPPDGRLQ